MPGNEIKIIKPLLSLNKKLGNIRFEQAFDTSTITHAEQTIAKNHDAFKTAALTDYDNLKSIFADLKESDLSKNMYEKISQLAFSIKARATTGGLPLASEIANSMYMFSDAAIGLLPQKSIKVLNLHFHALTEVFDDNGNSHDELKSKKIIKGLEEVSQKFLKQND